MISKEEIFLFNTHENLWHGKYKNKSKADNCIGQGRLLLDGFTSSPVHCNFYISGEIVGNIGLGHALDFGTFLFFSKTAPHTIFYNQIKYL